MPYPKGRPSNPCGTELEAAFCVECERVGLLTQSLQAGSESILVMGVQRWFLPIRST